MARTLDVWLESFRILLIKRDIHLSDKEIARAFGQPRERFAEWGVQDIEVAYDEMEDVAKRMLPNVDLYPDALEVLAELEKRNKNMALITSSRRDMIEDVLRKYSIAHFFDVIVAGNDITHYKPHPESLLKAMQELGASPEESIMIGDTIHDIEAATNAHVESIIFYPPEHETFYDLDILQSKNPTHTVEDFREVLNLV